MISHIWSLYASIVLEIPNFWHLPHIANETCLRSQLLRHNIITIISQSPTDNISKLCVVLPAAYSELHAYWIYQSRI